MLSALLLLALAALQGHAQGVPPPAKAVARTLRPDVLVFVLDDVADSDIDVTPLANIHALAAQGMRFTRAYSHAWCAPTRDTLLTSHRVGFERGEACAPCAMPLPAGTPTLAGMLSSAGYRTCTLGKWHTGSAELGRWQDTPAVWGFTDWHRVRPIGATCDLPGPQVWVDNGVVTQFSADDSITLRDAVIAWWNSTPSPRFAVVNFAAAHYPFDYPPTEILPPGYPRPPFSSNRQRYVGKLVGADFVIGQVLAACASDVVIVCGDNGTPGRVEGQGLTQSAVRPDQDPDRVKLSCYEDGIRVPLIIRAPKVAPGSVCADVVGLVDFMPTVLELAGLRPMGETMDGQSLVPALRGRSLPARFVFAWNPTRGDSAVVSKRWKLLRTKKGLEELYDLEADPRELVTLPATKPEADELRAWRDALELGG